MIGNSRGSTLIQVMVVGSLLAGLSVYVIRSNQTQNKLQKNVVNKASQSAVARDFSETLLEGQVCFNTFKKAGTLSNNMELAGLYNKNERLIYAKNSELYGQIISNIQLIDFVPSSGRKYQRSIVTVTTLVKAADQAVGGKARNHRIPVFLITENNVVDTCVSDETGSALDALRRACQDLKGTFNETTAACENFYGTNGPVLNHVKEKFCESGIGENCVHPYASQACSGTDVRGQNHNNWYLKGFNAAGALNCVCAPVECEDPKLFCEGTDLGTDWCQYECPKGTKTTDECAPSTPSDSSCTSWGDWAPLANTQCPDKSVTQTRSCTSGKTETQTQTVTGTKVCDTKTWNWQQTGSGPDTMCNACPKSYRYYYNGAEVPASFSRPTCSSSIEGATYMVTASWTASMSWASGVNRTSYQCVGN